MAGKARRKKRQRTPPRLCVAFDTNVLFTDAAHHLLRRDVKDLIEANSNHLDLSVEWYLPSVVVAEREYQMQSRALNLYKQVQKLDRLLGHQSTTQEIILARIRSVIEEQINELKIDRLEVDTNDVKWQDMIDASAYRRPPFDPGENEKGFRDAIVAEAFMQLVSRSPSTPRQCRLAFVSDDDLLRLHIEQRTSTNQNVRVLESINDLEGLINTLVSEVPEAKVAEWREKALKYFFVKADESTLYYKKDIGSILAGAYAAELAETPIGQYDRKNGTWFINAPVFSRKERQRIHWTTKITVEAKLFNAPLGFAPGLLGMPFSDDGPSPILAIPTQSREKAGTGKSIIELHWSVSISPQQERLSSPKIEGHEFIETTWEMVQTERNALTNALLKLNLPSS